jgi:hypothetical protein
MKILLTNNHLVTAGGTETYVYAMACELIRLGHEVEIFTFQTGWFSDKMKELLNIPIITNPEELGNYDLILANHNTCVDACYKHGYITQTCHGTMPKLEQPNRKACEFVSISNEVYKYLKSEYNIDSEVYFNGIDCERFKPVKPLNDKIQSVLSLCQDKDFNIYLEGLFTARGIKFNSANKFLNPKFNIEDYINDSDMVISLGRGAYEALACGRAVLVLDKRPYQQMMGEGLILPSNFWEFIRRNCSGRVNKITEAEWLIDRAIADYNPTIGEFGRGAALSYLDIRKIIKEYLHIYGDA